MQINKTNNDSQSFGYELVYGKSARKIPTKIKAVIEANKKIASTIGDGKKIYIGVSSYDKDHLDLHLPTGFPLDRSQFYPPELRKIPPIYQIVRTVSDKMYSDSDIGIKLIKKLKEISGLYDNEALRYAKNTKQSIDVVKATAQPRSWKC